MIGGNVTGVLQTFTTAKNAISESVKAWADAQTIKGWLDLHDGSSGYTAYASKAQESTHVFVADWAPLDSSIKAETCRMVIDSRAYDVTLIDDPMGMHRQLEIYLKYTGGVQRGGGV